MHSISLKTIIFKIFEYVHPWQSHKLLVFLWSVCWHYREWNISAPRRSFSKGIENWALACIASKRWCVSSIMKSQMSIRLFFLPLSSQVLLWLEIVLFLLVIHVLTHVRTRTPNVSWMWLFKHCEGAITRNQYNIGDFVSTDQFICTTPGHVPTKYGHESQDCHFQGSTIFNDEASGLFQVKNQVSLDANELVMCKAWFNSGFTTNVSVKSNTIMVTMVSSLLRSFGMAVRRNNRVKSSPVLVP